MWPWPIRRKRLIEGRTRLVKLVARYQATITEIDAELRAHGVEPKAYRPAWPYSLLAPCIAVFVALQTSLLDPMEMGHFNGLRGG